MQTCSQKVVLLADDDIDDRMMAEEAVAELGAPYTLRTVRDGEELMQYLHSLVASADHNTALPSLVLLDLNMPRKNGFETLREIKNDPSLRRLPVVMLTTSADPEDISTAYHHGASGYMKKPNSWNDFVKKMRVCCEYWFRASQLPLRGGDQTKVMCASGSRSTLLD